MKTEELKTDILFHTLEYGRGGCRYCRHVTKRGAQDMSGGWACAAYPDGIPYGLARGVHSHLTAYPFDRGIQYSEEPMQITDDEGNPCWLYHEWNGAPNVVANFEDLPPYAAHQAAKGNG